MYLGCTAWNMMWRSSWWVRKQSWQAWNCCLIICAKCMSKTINSLRITFCRLKILTAHLSNTDYRLLPLLLLALQPTVGVSLLSDSPPFCSFFTLHSLLSYSHTDYRLMCNSLLKCTGFVFAQLCYIKALITSMCFIPCWNLHNGACTPNALT
jgi:hypothetical protein